MANLDITKPEQFNPDKVITLAGKDGKLPANDAEYIMSGIAEKSAIMQSAVYEDMTGLASKTIRYMSKIGDGNWIHEGGRIKTDKPQILEATLVAKKLGVIVPITNEELDYDNGAPLLTADLTQKVQSAFARAFDKAAIFNVDNVFTGQSILEVAQQAGTLTRGEISGATDVLDLEGEIEDAGLNATHFLSTVKNGITRQLAVKVGDTNVPLYDKADQTLDDLPYIKIPRGDGVEFNNLIVGDFDQVRYGTPQDLKFKLLTEATLSSIEGEDGKDINLGEEDMVALRFTASYAFAILNSNAVAGIIAPDQTPDDNTTTTTTSTTLKP